MDEPANNVVPLRPSSRARLVRWEPALRSSTLSGWATVAFPGGWTVSSIPVFRNDDKLSAGSPSVPELGRDGKARLGADGKRVYTSLIRFENTAAAERWSAAVLGALTDAGIWP